MTGVGAVHDSMKLVFQQNNALSHAALIEWLESQGSIRLGKCSENSLNRPLYIIMLWRGVKGDGVVLTHYLVRALEFKVLDLLEN